MEKSVLPYSSTGYFAAVITDYINGSEKLKPFYCYAPRRESFPLIIERRKEFPLHRDVVHNALKKQFEPFHDINLSDEVSKNISLLKNNNTFTVVTAHQPNLFLGPLYLIYKIISAIKLSKQLNDQFSDYHFVPVYWMGSEDHDKEELNHIHLFNKTFTWHTEQEGAFGRMKTESLEPLIDEIKTVFGNSEEADRCVKLLKDCYLKEETIAAATKRLLYHFFSGDGLVIADGDDPLLKQLFIPIMKKELMEQSSFPIVNKSSEAFSKNYAAQIAPREINLFYLDKNIRQRIVKKEDHWQVLNSEMVFSTEELIALLNSNPEKFSPNVILRPVYQELVLPNIAFIGGGAEVAYWMLLKELFAASGVAFPMLLLRNSALWIEKNHVSRLKKLNLSTDEIFQPVDVLINRFLKKQSGHDISLDAEKNKLKLLMESTLLRVSQFDASLKGAVEAEQTKMQKSLELLEDKLRKAAKKKEEVSIQQLQTLKEKLFPSNSLQERYDNFLPYYLKYGDDFFSELKLQFEPMEQQFSVILDVDN